MLARIQERYQEQGVKVVAINIEPFYSLNDWVRFWQSTGAGDVLWAQDTQRVTARMYELVALGTEVIMDRKGRITFRSDGPVGFKRLQAEIDKLLSAR